MHCAQKGDQVRYRQLLESLQPVVERAVYRRIFCIEDAQEVVQDILLSVHLARDTYEVDRSFAVWLRTIIHHRIVDYIRRRKRTAKLVTTSMETVNTSDLEQATAAAGVVQFSADLEEVVRDLPLVQRHLLLELISPDSEPQTLAERLSLTPVNLRVQLHRLKSKLRGAV